MNNLIVVLASASLGRKEILSTLKIPFEIIPSTVDEDSISDPNPKKLVIKRAQAKGEEVTRKLKTKNYYLVVSADSMVVYQNKTYGKPKNKSAAKKILCLLSGKTHDFYTGMWIKNTQTGEIYEKICKSQVSFKKITSSEIDWFANNFPLENFAGAYSLTTSPQFFITKIQGSVSNIIGLPLEICLPIFRKYKII